MFLFWVVVVDFGLVEWFVDQFNWCWYELDGLENDYWLLVGYSFQWIDILRKYMSLFDE